MFQQQFEDDSVEDLRHAKDLGMQLVAVHFVDNDNKKINGDKFQVSFLPRTGDFLNLDDKLWVVVKTTFSKSEVKFGQTSLLLPHITVKQKQD